MGILGRADQWVQRVEAWLGLGLFAFTVGGSLIAAVVWAAGRSIPGWVVFALGALLVVLAPLMYLLGRHRAPPSPAPELRQQLADAEAQFRLLYDALESIQQAVAMEEYWELDELVERGVLGTARGVLLRRASEDIRLAVLVPRNDGTRWRMRWAAGHRPESVRNFDREIDLTMAGLAYRRGEFIVCDNVREDERFTPNPRETRPFSSLVAMPLRVGERVVGAFSVVSTEASAFASTDVWFLKNIGAVLDVLVSMEYDIEGREADEDAGG